MKYYFLILLATFSFIPHSFLSPLKAAEFTSSPNFFPDLAPNFHINPPIANNYLHRGLVFLQLQQYDLALSHFNQAININPQDATAFFGRGLVYAFLDNLPKTQQNWQQASTLFQQQNNLQGYQFLQQALKTLSQLE